MSQPIVIDAEIIGTELRPELRERAQRYRGHQRASAEEALQAFAELAAARQEAAHGEWAPWLAEAGINDTTARAQLQLYEQIQQDPRFADRFRGGWLSESAGRELLSAPAAVQDAILSRPPESKPPTVAEIRSEKRAAAPPQPNRPTSGDLAPARPTPPPIEAEPLTPYEQRVAAAHTPPAPAAGEVIAEVPAAAPPPLMLTPMAPAPLPGLGAAALKTAEALVALLEQTLALAQVERDRLQRDHPDAHYTLPDEPVEQAARLLLASPALKASAGFLAMNAREA